jgi:hypothetical protein
MTTPSGSLGPTAFVRRSDPQPTVVYNTYWEFAAKRQEVYFGRLRKLQGPWTTDRILAEHRFTNAYRAADRVSQFLIRNVLYAGSHGAAEAVFRTLLFKLFNKIETWQLLEKEFGELRVDSFDVTAFDRVLSDARQGGARIYSAAYIMPNAPRHDEMSLKHRTHLDLLAYILKRDLHLRMLEASSMKALYEALLSLPSIGPFLAYQYAIDLTYSEYLPFSENDFVQPGPGALNGLSKCFSSLGDYSPAEAIAWVTERQTREFVDRGLNFKTLWGRPLHLIDCQNLFCEVDKYARVAHPEFSADTGRSRIKQKYFPSGAMPRPWFPPKWKLDTSEVEVAVLAEPSLADKFRASPPEQSSFAF